MLPAPWPGPWDLTLRALVASRTPREVAVAVAVEVAAVVEVTVVVVVVVTVGLTVVATWQYGEGFWRARARAWSSPRWVPRARRRHAAPTPRACRLHVTRHQYH